MASKSYTPTVTVSYRDGSSSSSRTSMSTNESAKRLVLYNPGSLGNRTITPKPVKRKYKFFDVNKWTSDDSGSSESEKSGKVVRLNLDRHLTSPVSKRGTHSVQTKEALKNIVQEEIASTSGPQRTGPQRTGSSTPSTHRQRINSLKKTVSTSKSLSPKKVITEPQKNVISVPYPQRESIKKDDVSKTSSKVQESSERTRDPRKSTSPKKSSQKPSSRSSHKRKSSVPRRQNLINKEIWDLQKSTKQLIQNLPFARVVQEIGMEQKIKPRFQGSAFKVLLSRLLKKLQNTSWLKYFKMLCN